MNSFLQILGQKSRKRSAEQFLHQQVEAFQQNTLRGIWESNFDLELQFGMKFYKIINCTILLLFVWLYFHLLCFSPPSVIGLDSRVDSLSPRERAVSVLCLSVLHDNFNVLELGRSFNCFNVYCLQAERERMVLDIKVKLQVNYVTLLF